MKTTVAMLKALSDENRFRIVMMLEQRPLCVCEIDYVLHIAVSTISSHLKILKNAGLIIDVKDGRWIIYKINYENKKAVNLIKYLLNNLDDNSLISKDRELVKNITRESCTFKQL